MELSANGLSIHLGVLSPVNDEDRGRVTVVVSEAGFGANFVAWLQSGDVEQFANELSELHGTVGVTGRAVLHCFEPGISIEIESDKQGHIAGRYEFKNETAGGFYPVMSGTIDLDQSFLPHWEKECRQFIVELHG